MGWGKSIAKETRRIPKKSATNHNSNKKNLINNENINDFSTIKRRSDSIVILQQEIQSIKPKFESSKNEEEKSKKPGKVNGKVKRTRDSKKRYKRTFKRVYIERDGDQSSRSSLQSDWQTINSSYHEKPQSIHISSKQDKDIVEPKEHSKDDESPFDEASDKKSDKSRKSDPKIKTEKPQSDKKSASEDEKEQDDT